MKSSDKRRFKRLVTEIILRYRLYDKEGAITHEEDATAINISKTGMLLQTNEALTPHVRLDITLNIPETPVHLKCQSMYSSKSDDGSYESGIQILKVNKKDIKAYLLFIKRLESKTHGAESLRPGTRDITNVIKRISAEHKIINQYVVVLAKMMKTSSPGSKEVETLMQLMRQDISTHFKIEENLFFNVCLVTLPGDCGEIVSLLTADHKEMLNIIDALIDSLQYQIKNDGPVTPPLKEKICDLLEIVKQHAKVELQELFPLIEKNAEAKKMILAKIRNITEK